MTRPGLLTAAGIALSVAALAAQGAGDARFGFERQVLVGTPGPQRLDLDAALLAAVQRPTVVGSGERSIATGGLGDLRLFSASNVEVPYLLVPPSPDARTFVSGRVLPVTSTEKTSGFEADLGELTMIDALDVGRTSGTYLKRFNLEGSGDRERWTQLVAEGTAFNLPTERLRHTLIEFDAGSYRYLRVTWDDTNSGRVAAPDQVGGRRVTVSSPGPVLRQNLPFEVRPAEPGRSRFRITLPAGRLPITALELSIGGGNLLRDARVLEASLVGQQALANVIGQARLARVVREQAAAEDLRILIRPPNEPQIELVVDNGDNDPLDLKAVTAVFAELPWVYFESPAERLTARYGDPRLAGPRYDLEAARANIPATWSRATWAEAPPITITPEPEALPMPTTGSAIDPAGFSYAREIPGGVAGLISVPLDASVMAHSGLASRSLKDVRVVDRTNLQVPYLLERRDEPLIIDAALERRDHLPVTAQGLVGGLTIYLVKVPFAELPASRLVFTTRARVFQRTVTLGVIVPADERRQARFQEISSSTWAHAEESIAAPSLSFPLPESRRGDLFLLVQEGDNQPLAIEKAAVILPSYALRLFRPADTPLRLLYGRDDIQAPRYDLQLLAPQLMGRKAEEVVAGAEQPVGSRAADKVPAVPPAVFWAALGLAVVVLLLFVVRLMRREGGAI